MIDRSRTRRLIAAIVSALLGLTALAGCGEVGSSAPPDPQGLARAYGIVTTQCGDASGTEGTAVAIGGGQVLTSAHVIVAATTVVVQTPGGEEIAAQILGVDTNRDLALLAIPDDGFERVNFVEVAEEALVTGYTRSGPVPVETSELVMLDVVEVRGTDRSTRAGYRVSGELGSGDSGSGLYTDEGLAASVFATSTDDDSVSWATAASEIEAFLGMEFPDSYACDPDMSKLTNLDFEPVAQG